MQVVNSAPSGLVAYLRVSTIHQAESGLSLEAQGAEIRRYAVFREVELLGVYSDPGFSGSSLKRPGLQAALEHVQSVDGAAMVVSKLDRLTRSNRDLWDLLEGPLAPDRVPLISLGENIDAASHTGRMILGVLMSVLQWEREAAGHRTATALEARKERGLPKGGRAPFGYRWESGELVGEPVEAEVLRVATELRSEGMTLRGVGQALSNMGYRGRGGRKLGAAVLWRAFNRAKA